jgi:hypothetical protein
MENPGQVTIERIVTGALLYASLLVALLLTALRCFSS